jgi:capsular exopolysaccharide synthesis family protein
MTLWDESWSEFGEPRAGEQATLRRYLETVLERRWFVVVAIVLCAVVATVYAVTAPKVYEANADVLVTPVPDTEATVLGLGLLRAASDPTRDVTTASLLIDNVAVATRVGADLRLLDSPQALLQRISVNPVASSSIVSITASTGSPLRSQQLANEFATAAVQERTEQLYQALDPAIASMRARIAAITGGGSTATGALATQPLYQQLAALEALRSAPDPTLRVVTPAALPTSPSAPRTKLVVAGGLIAGLLIGIAGAFVLKALDPRRAREGGLGMTRLSVLTRVPLLRRSGRTRHAFDESFRSLRTTLRFASADNPIATIAITSPSEKEGKTTTSFQLAMAMLEAGQSVLLVEADPFRPGLRSLVEPNGATPRPGLLEYLSGMADLDEIVAPTTVPNLMFIHAGFRQTTSMTGLLEGERGRSFASKLAALADVVVLDCPPVGPRSDALLIASYADAVLIIVDLERSDERVVVDTVRRLGRTGAQLLGIVLNRDTSASATYDYREESQEPASPGRTPSFRR